MVGRDQQQMILRPVCKQVGSEEGAVGQIEWLAKCSSNLGVYFSPRPASSVDRFERDGAAGANLLDQLAVRVNPKNGAKGVVTVDDRLQSRLESRSVRRRKDSHAESEVIDSAPRQNLLHEPQRFLAGREGKGDLDAIT